MTSLLSPAEAQALGAGLGLATVDLQAVIDREEAEMIRRFGAHYTGATVTEIAEGGGRALYLKRAITSITSIAESLSLGDTPQTVAGTDYYVWASEGRIVRLPETTKWGRVATVVYVPLDDTNLRKMVLVELVRIATEQSTSAGGGMVSGLSFSISGGTSDASGAGWHAQREAQYARLGWLSR